MPHSVGRSLPLLQRSNERAAVGSPYAYLYFTTHCTKSLIPNVIPFLIRVLYVCTG